MKRMARAFGVGVALTAGAVGGAAAQATGLTVHGYLTQAYADATDYPVLGIPVDGTTDYRALAIQFRYGLTGFDALVIQLSHLAFGINPASGYTGDVTLDWAFYRRRFEAGSVRVGRLPMPRGLWNEVRDAGTLLPFFRAPFSFYSETAEVLDGVAVTAESPSFGGFELEGDAYAGSYDFVFSGHTPGGPYVWDARIEGVIGAQLWLYTPVDGLRVGVGAQTHEEEDETGTDTGDWVVTWQTSLEADLRRVVLRAEYEEIDAEGWGYTAYYVQGGVRVLGPIVFNGQAEFADMRFALPGGTLDLAFNRDYAVGVKYAFRPDLQFKAEAHTVRGYGMEMYVDPLGPALETAYVVLSVAASF